MIGIGQRALRQIPGVVPAEAGVIDQNPHQFRHGQRGMRVVELNGDLVRQGLPIVIVPAEAHDDVGQRAGDEEVFLHEAQSLAPSVESSG